MAVWCLLSIIHLMAPIFKIYFLSVVLDIILHMVFQKEAKSISFLLAFTFLTCVSCMCVSCLCVCTYAHVHLCGYKHGDQRRTWVSSPIAFFSSF